MTLEPAAMTATELAERLAQREAQSVDQRDALVLLDVREPWEFDRASIPDSTLVPLSTLPSAAARLSREATYVVLCHHGMRSDMAANWLRAQGFLRVINLTGGIDAWSADVDPTVPRY